MVLYFAGTYGGGGGTSEEQLLLGGVRNRLASYYDISDSARTDGGGGKRGQAVARFWLDCSRDERLALVKLYVAGNGKSPGSPQRDFGTGVQNRLLSYAFLGDWAKEEFAFWVGSAHPPSVSVFLDSGAFSAFTLGRAIDLGEYCAYVEQHKGVLAAYAVLDVIGDLPATQRNLADMRARGLDPVPVYHLDREPLDVLEGLLAESGYVALGGMAGHGFTRTDMRRMLDACWRVIERRWPVRIHGLGVMAQWVLERYPFYSADSSSAIMGAGMGRVLRFEGGVLTSEGWRENLARTWDGMVADGIGRVATAERKSDSAHEGRRIRNIQAQLALERYVTDLWSVRGIRWE